VAVRRGLPVAARGSGCTIRAGSAYSLLVFGLSAVAISALVLRALVMKGEGRRRLVLFCGGLMAGSLPLVISVTLESIPA
jgi:hypothetical protein